MIGAGRRVGPSEASGELEALLAAGVDDCLDGPVDRDALRLRFRLAERRVLGRLSGTRDPVDRRLVVTDRMASLGVLAAGVAHELNNPLAYVTMNVALLHEQLRGAEDAGSGRLRSSLEAALDGCERMRVILQDLQTFSRAARWESGGPVDVRDVIDASIALAHNEIRHRARLVRSYGDVLPVAATRARLGQVFLNLLTNAVHAIPVGAAGDNEIRVTVRPDEPGRLAVEIADTGVGIPEENLPRVFEPFFSTKGEGVGTGLGLAISQRIVEDCGGEITVESAPGNGTTVRVVLPTTRKAADHGERAPDVRLGTLRGRVLLVDDEPHVADALRRGLLHQAPGLEVVHAGSGEHALDLLQEGGPWDAVVCDLMMPNVSGMDLHDAVAARDPELARRIVFMTGGAFTERARQFAAREGLLLLEKPFALNALLRALHSAIGTRSE